MAMRSTNTNMTIAEYLEQMRLKQVTINHDYQRTDKVWPTSAKSNLIDTILNGYPMPKLIFSQITDLDTLRTRKEVVDGQQRTAAVLEFFSNKYSLTRGDFAGKRFSDLNDHHKRDFLSYELSIDVFTSGSDDEIREVFRRINSYQVPLNPQERRHATHQGELKWFIKELGKEFSTALRKIGALTERQVSRMADLELFAELTYFLLNGVKTGSPKLLDKMYTENDALFKKRDEVYDQIRCGLGKIIDFKSIHNGPLVSRGNLYALFGALVAAKYPETPAASVLELQPPFNGIDDASAEANLSVLAEALEGDSSAFADFVSAARQGTNTEKNRTTRLRWFYKAITSERL